MVNHQNMNTVSVKDYHAHLYYTSVNIQEAQDIAEQLGKIHPIKVGTFHQKPVGPHPTWSCQLTFTPDQLGVIISWLLLNHGSVDVFIHANTGDNLIDHTQYIMWIGRSYPLNVSIFSS